MKAPIPITVNPSLERRFLAAVNRAGDDECWEWLRHRNQLGYGRILETSSRRLYMSHRVAWTLAHGPIPEGLRVLHKCDNPPCCNPAHLFLGTTADNSSDKIAKGRDKGITTELRERTHCARAGHPLSGDNLYVGPNGFRQCRQCKHELRREKAKEAGAIPMQDRTHCPAGHEYSGDNVRIYKDGWRQCLACRRKRDLDRYYRKKAEAAATGVPFRRVSA